jgi:hypothetical protein
MPRARRRCALVATALAALACNQGLEPMAASGACPSGFVGICGTIRIRGAIPDSTDFVIVVAFEQFPQTTGDLFLYEPVPPPQLPLGDTVATYRLPLARNRYEWILAVWKKQGSFDDTPPDSLLREAGFYRDPTDPAQPGAVIVTGGMSDVDFVVDFDAMHPVSYWFPPAAP